jgi:hypothetical protein
MNLPTLRVDGENIVTAVDDAWQRLAAGGFRVAGVGSPVVVGAPFHQTVESSDTYALYEAMFERVRARFRVAVDVRAVSRDCAVRYELGLVPHGSSGEVVVSLRFLREQQRWTLPLLDPAVRRLDESVEICDFCQCVLGFDWVEPQIACRQLRVDVGGPQPRLRSTVCGRCERRVYHAAGASRLGLAS